MNVFFGLLSLVALSLFYGWVLRRPAALMPIVAVATAMLWFMAAGCLGLLWPAGIAWYLLCAAGLVVALVRMKKQILSLITPGFVCFVVGAALFILLFGLTKPMLTQWDEFTFWGPAAKVTSQQNLLYTTATSSLIARTYPPGIIAFSYMMQFFGGFTEHGYIAVYAVLYLACFAAGTAVWGKNKSATIAFFAGMVVLPLLFEINSPPGQLLRAYLNCMADLPMAVLFGGALCFYFAGGEKGGRLMLPFGLVLGALTSVKDMGLALALCALFVVALDMLFCERERLAFLRLKKGWAWLAACGFSLLMIAASYGAWALHLKTISVDRFNLGSQGSSLGMVDMLFSGIKMLFGTGRTEQFTKVLGLMGEAFFSRRGFLFGSGAVVLALILLITACAFVLGATRRQRKRVALFTLGMGVCFAAFYIFNIFTYAIIFKPNEAEMLREYERYISPFWVAWLMGSLTLLARAATYHKASFYRLRLGRAVSALACLGLVAGVMLRGNWNGNFLNLSPSLYTQRLNVRAVAAAAAAEGEGAGDVIYILSQGDNGMRFYIFGHELAGVREQMFTGIKRDERNQPVLDENGLPVVYSDSASTLVKPGEEHWGAFDLECSPEDWATFLKARGCTHVLLDVVDEYILTDFAPLFSDELAGWTELERGNTYYRVSWQQDGSLLLLPEGEVSAA